MRGWRQAASEILRVVKDEGAIVLMHTGTGAEIPWISGRYLALCRQHGHAAAPPGASSARDVVDYLVGLGCSAEWVRGRWCWTERIRLGTASGYVRSRAYAFTAVTPAEVHVAVCAQLSAEALREFGEATAAIEVPNQIHLVVVSRPPGEVSSRSVPALSPRGQDLARAGARAPFRPSPAR